MTSENGFLQKLSDKCGLGGNSRVLRRASELQRLLQSQGCLGPGAALGASATAQAVICLHLASEEEEACTPFILQALTKLSGIKSKSQYMTMKENTSSSLGIHKQLTVEEICVKLGCPHIRQKALDMLAKYVKKVPNSHNLNLSAPLFSCAAVAAACKTSKTTYDKNEMFTLSKSKRVTFQKVLADILEANETKPKPKDGPKVEDVKEGVLSERNEQDDAEPIAVKKASSVSKKRRTEEDEEKDFEAWKMEMLKKAGRI